MVWLPSVESLVHFLQVALIYTFDPWFKSHFSGYAQASNSNMTAKDFTNVT
jgi:hypothetical protein